VALIVETPNLRFMPGMVRNGLFHAVVPVRASSNAAGSYRLEVSTDLQNWEAVATDSARLGVMEFVDPDASTPARFYRAVPDSNPEPEQ
jgi:hypothetical protein